MISLDRVSKNAQVCVDRTGGTVVLGDSFSMHIFQQSFKKMFEPDENG